MPFLQEFAVFMADGVVEFQNPDTFKIHCFAQTGESWVFKTDDIGNLVMAEVTDSYLGMVLGVVDSIKVVNVENGITFHLSKNHGITLWTDASNTFTLQSIPSENLGGSALSNAAVFNFNPGDVFVYLHLDEQGDDSGWEDFYEIGSHSIVRYDVLDVSELQGTRFISMQTTRYQANYSNFSGMISEESIAESFISELEIPLTDDCQIYNWPINGPMPASIPSEIHAVHSDLNLSAITCDVSSDAPLCTEFDLLGGSNPSSIFSRNVAGLFGNKSLLSSSMNLYNGPVLDPESSLEEVLNQDPREFYEWENLIRCGFEVGESSAYIENGETLLTEAESNITFYDTKLFALGEGLGIVAFDREFLGFGSWCLSRSVMIGYQKIGEEPFGFIPEAIDLLTLSAEDHMSASPLLLYPNPATSIVNLDLQGSMLTIATIHDIQGRQILESALNQNSPTIDVSTLPKGIYLLRAFSSNGSMHIKKLVVK